MPASTANPKTLVLSQPHYQKYIDSNKNNINTSTKTGGTVAKPEESVKTKVFNNFFALSRF